MKNISLSPQLQLVGVAQKSSKERQALPLFLTPVSAGFPSPASDYLDKKLDLHEYLIRNEAATFFLRACGNSMVNASINDGDLLIVDRSYEASHGRIVIAALDGELTVKRIVRRGAKVFLAPENPDYPEIDITEQEYIHIWGVVTTVIHSLL